MSRHVYGLMVTGNEADRYLRSAINNALEAVDVLFLYDDQSIDGSADIIQSFNSATVVYQRRPDDVPSFLEHEGRFRQASWAAFERYVQPTTSDWVIGIDSDEVLVGATECRPCELKLVLDRAEGHDAVLLPRPEVWGYDHDGWPLLRTDGMWGTINCTRLFKYRPGGKIRDVAMGCGSEPEGFCRSLSMYTGGLELLHVGYAHFLDRQDKWQRYTNHPIGHNPAHIQSILASPTVKRWGGLIPPNMTRGDTC